MPNAPVLSEPPEAEQWFGARLDLARRYASILASSGIERGLLGPREVPRLWERHLLNCVAVTRLLPLDARVVDVGSGAGLPGLVLAIARPDLRVELVESLQRRTTFLTEVVDELDLAGQVRVIAGRAEDVAVRKQVGSAQWITARAVAPIDRLVKWCLPLLAPGGQLLALKGSTAAEELAASSEQIKRHGGTHARIVSCGNGTATVSVAVIERIGSKRPARQKGQLDD